MTKQEAIDLFDGSARRLADTLGISEQAVSQWGEEVPELRVYQIRDILAKQFKNRKAPVKILGKPQ